MAEDLTNYEEKTSEGYRVGTRGKTMTVSFYSMFLPTLSPDYNNSYCNSQNGGNTWLDKSKLINTELVNNRRKYTFNVVVDEATGTDATYQLHKATIHIKQNNTTVKSYILWRGASYVGYPMDSGSASPYYTAIKKGSYYWAPANCGAIRVAQASDGKNKTVDGTGNIYQWGRKDATNHDGSIASAPTGNSNPNNNTFYKTTNNPKDWLSPQNNSLWNGNSKGVNDPCPSGYRIPTSDELRSIGNATTWDGSDGLFKVNAENGYPQLILPAAGLREFSSGSSTNLGTGGYYWSSSVPAGSTQSNHVFFTTAKFNDAVNVRAYGMSVRCIRQ
ncbi:MAG: hypothetical protein PARBA_01483 [Parabacteroides sp.]